MKEQKSRKKQCLYFSEKKQLQDDKAQRKSDSTFFDLDVRLSLCDRDPTEAFISESESESVRSIELGLVKGTRVQYAFWIHLVMLGVCWRTFFATSL